MTFPPADQHPDLQERQFPATTGRDSKQEGLFTCVSSYTGRENLSSVTKTTFKHSCPIIRSEVIQLQVHL